MRTLASNLLQCYTTIQSNFGIAKVLENINGRLHVERDIFAHSSE